MNNLFNTCNPLHIGSPSSEAIAELKVGDFVELEFRSGGEALMSEKIWCRILALRDCKKFCGE